MFVPGEDEGLGVANGRAGGGEWVRWYRREGGTEGGSGAQPTSQLGTRDRVASRITVIYS